MNVVYYNSQCSAFLNKVQLCGVKAELYLRTHAQNGREHVQWAEMGEKLHKIGGEYCEVY